MNERKNIALYIHWPFCESKCPYCDFNSHVRDKIEEKRFLDGYLTEIKYYKDLLSEKEISSIFFGGGTPSLMSSDAVHDIIQRVKNDFTVKENLEITLEANPSSSEVESFKNLKQAGINRLSLGIQSFNDERLKFLGRKHDSYLAKNAIDMASRIFKNFSFDLIYNLPEQSEKELEESLNIAFSYGSPHLSLYQLTIEKGTEFYSEFKNGYFKLPDEETSLALYNKVTDECSKRGLERYEVSNYSKNGFECKHNLSYWHYDEYLGIGAGAHSRVDIKGARHSMFDIHNPEKWLKEVEEKGNGLQLKKQMEVKQIADELIFMGLRIKEGLSLKKFCDLTGYELEDYYKNGIIRAFEEEGLLALSKEKIKLSNKGLLLHGGIVKKLSDNTCIAK